MTGRVNKTNEVLFALGGSHSCVVDIDKKLDCFGWNWYGQTNFEVIQINQQKQGQRYMTREKNAQKD